MNPRKNRLLVRVQAEVVKKGQEVKSDSVMRAEVLKAGPETDIKVGEYVVFSPYGMDEVMVDGEKLIIISDELILATYAGKQPNKKAKS